MSEATDRFFVGVLIGLIIGLAIGASAMRARMHSEALTRGYAWHSRETGAWQWKTPEEYAIGKINADPLKLEAAFRVLALPTDGKIISEELTSPEPTNKKTK